MIRIKIRNRKSNQITHQGDFETQELADFWITKNELKKSWGKLERWIISEKDLNEIEYLPNENILEALESRLIELRPAIPEVLDEQGAVKYEAVPAIIATEYKLACEYIIEVIDLSLDPEWLLQECYRKRVKEYPPLGDLADAIYHQQSGNSIPMDDYKAKVVAVKLKYPKP